MLREIEILINKLVSNKEYGRDLQPVDRVAIIRKIQEIAPVRTYELLLPLLFSFKSKPLTLKDYRPFSPLFYADRPKKLLVKSGRQVGKSLSVAVSGILLPGQNPNFTSLITTPLAEQVKRLRTIYVKPLMDDSPLPFLWKGPKTKSTLSQHEFPNRSNLLFSFASLSADRIRGIAADAVSFDEIQDFNLDNLPVIASTADASKYGLIQYTGTPKSLDNPIHGLWMQSSQAEWVIKCQHCNHYNIPAAEHDLLDMIGPWHPDISEECPGTICAKCKRPINPRYGHWQHRHTDRKMRFAGYHIPQVILPLHFANKDMWRALVEKQQGSAHMTTAMFYNEILGESVDAGQKLITVTELTKAACLPWTNHPGMPDPAIKERMGRYRWTVLSADWSGGGEAGISFTVIALLGILPDGTIDCLWGKRFTASLDHVAEASECKYWMDYFNVDCIAHDYTGAGTLRETFLIQSGVASESIIPVQYVASAKYNLMNEVPPTANHSRRYFRADKTRSLLYTISCIQQCKLRFFQYDGEDTQNSLMNDFLALIEEKSGGRTGSESYMINRNPAVPDDFAHAVNIGCLALWYCTNLWPDFSDRAKPNAVQVQASYDEDMEYDWNWAV